MYVNQLENIIQGWYNMAYIGQIGKVKYVTPCRVGILNLYVSYVKLSR